MHVKNNHIVCNIIIIEFENTVVNKYICFVNKFIVCQNRFIVFQIMFVEHTLLDIACQNNYTVCNIIIIQFENMRGKTNQD